MPTMCHKPLKKLMSVAERVITLMEMNDYKIQIDRQCYAVGLLVVFSNLIHYTTSGTRNLQNFIKYLERKEKVKRVHIDLWD